MRALALAIAVLVVIAALVLVTRYAQPEPGSSRAIARAEQDANRAALANGKAAVAARLRNPDSARFSDTAVHVYAGRKLVCGHIDAKDETGAMAGRQRFLAGPQGAFVESEDPEGFAVAWDTGCKSPVLKD